MKYTVLPFAATLIFAAAAQASHNVSVSPMHEFANSGNVPTTGDRSKLRRRSQFVEVEVKTSGLDPLSMNTVWAVIFNEPRFCASSPCSAADLAFVPGHDPRVQSSFVNVTGGAADADGRGRFAGRLWEARRGANPVKPEFGPGLLDTRKAEIHIFMRGHGQPTGSLAELFAAISSYTGGCNDANAMQPPCEDQQFSEHLARN